VAAMPLVETREAAAPATSAAEKFRLVIIMVLILCIEGVKSAAEGLPAEGSGDGSLAVIVVEKSIPPKRSDKICSACILVWHSAALRMREDVS